MVYKELTKEDGYTLVEILITLAILSVVMSLVSVSFIFISNRMADWQNQISYFNDFNVINNQLNSDLFRAKEIIYSDTLLVVEMNNGNREYRWGGGLLRINNEPVFKKTDSTWINIIEERSQRTKADVIRYYITFKRSERIISDSSTIQVRRPIKWTPLKEKGGF